MIAPRHRGRRRDPPRSRRDGVDAIGGARRGRGSRGSRATTNPGQVVLTKAAFSFTQGSARMPAGAYPLSLGRHMITPEDVAAGRAQELYELVSTFLGPLKHPVSPPPVAPPDIARARIPPTPSPCVSCPSPRRIETRPSPPRASARGGDASRDVGDVRGVRVQVSRAE